MTYMDIVKMPDSGVFDNLIEILGSDSRQQLLDLDRGQRRRLLGKHMIEPTVVDRSEILSPTRWALEAGAPIRLAYSEVVGYRTKSGNESSLMVHLYEMNREDVPLVTEYEHVTLCGRCKGSSGSCPGYAPRFDNMKKSVSRFYVLTVTMDLAWALKYSGGTAVLGSWKLPITRADRLTMCYVRRLLNAFAFDNYTTLGLGSCSGRCRPCHVMYGGKCLKPGRGCSMESAGVDCDWLHSMLHGEWLPWGYVGMGRIVPTYQTRYAGILMDADPIDILHESVRGDYSYIDNIPDAPELLSMLMDVPSGVHSGCKQYVYSME